MIGANSFRGLPDSLEKIHFVEVGVRWNVSKSIDLSVEFRRPADRLQRVLDRADHLFEAQLFRQDIV